jgi:hypothetical protein
MKRQKSTDEREGMCSCGHRQFEHDDTFQKGHGECRKCKCSKFTWVAWAKD